MKLSLSGTAARRLQNLRLEWNLRRSRVDPFRYSLRKLRWFVHRKLGFPAIVPVGDRMRLWLPPVGASSGYFLWRDAYEPEIFFIRRILKPGMTFVDAGAHFGLYSLVASARVGPRGRVLAFEPDPRNFSVLLRNVRLNSAGNIRPYRAALGNHGGQIGLYLGVSSAMSSILDFQAPAQRVEVPMSALDDVLRESGQPRADVIKIDVEGAELAVLAGAKSTIEEFRPIVLLELNIDILEQLGHAAYEPGIFLQQRGYELFLAQGLRPELSQCHWSSVVSLLKRDRSRGLPSYRNLVAIHSSACGEI